MCGVILDAKKSSSEGWYTRFNQNWKSLKLKNLQKDLTKRVLIQIFLLSRTFIFNQEYFRIIFGTFTPVFGRNRTRCWILIINKSVRDKTYFYVRNTSVQGTAPLPQLLAGIERAVVFLVRNKSVCDRTLFFMSEINPLERGHLFFMSEIHPYNIRHHYSSYCQK